MVAEQIYEYSLRLTGFTEFGAPLADVLAGRRPMPPSGVRADVAFEGLIEGKLSGRIHGVDYFHLRPDGRMQLDIRAVVETDDGACIALEAGGVALAPAGGPILLLREHVRCTTAHEGYLWLNAQEIWAAGEADMEKREIRVKGYIAK
jgi:hypothetical protein